MKIGGDSRWYEHSGEHMDAECNTDLALGEPHTRSPDRRQTRPDEWGIDAPVPVATRHSASMASLQPAHYPGLHTRRKRRSIAVLPEYSCRLSYGLIYLDLCPRPLYDIELDQTRPTTDTSASAQRTERSSTSPSPDKARTLYSSHSHRYYLLPDQHLTTAQAITCQ